METKTIIIVGLVVLNLFLFFSILVFNYPTIIKEVSANPETASQQDEDGNVPSNFNFIQATNQKVNFMQNDWDEILKVTDISFCEQIKGSSMQPTLFTGNTVCFTTKFTEEELTAGTIIEFEQDDKTIVHRIKAIYPHYILAQGDNNVYAEQIDFKDIKGVAVAILLT